MERKQEKAAAVEVVTLRAVEATPESFAPFGQVVSAGSDRAMYGPDDAQLDLSGGIPRFYIMKLENQPLKFSTITHHANVTQCLASIGGQDWYLAVAKPSVVDGPPSSDEQQNGQDDGRKPAVKSRAGHYYLPPDPSEVCVFRVSGPKFLKLHKGTWHAGPLFTAETMHFYNLELSDTNSLTTKEQRSRSTLTYLFPRQPQVSRSASWTLSLLSLHSKIVDHTSHYFRKHDGVSFVVED